LGCWLNRVVVAALRTSAIAFHLSGWMRNLDVHWTKFRSLSLARRTQEAEARLSSTTCCEVAFAPVAFPSDVEIRRRAQPTWPGGQARAAGPGAGVTPPAGARTAWHRQRGAHFPHTGGRTPPNRPLRSITQHNPVRGLCARPRKAVGVAGGARCRWRRAPSVTRRAPLVSTLPPAPAARVGSQQHPSRQAADEGTALGACASCYCRWWRHLCALASSQDGHQMSDADARSRSA